ncbi:isopenicillin N synthase-like dioxygenase [Streptosporangium becharense]|uniref:Isopenicillin N synthase-like dioxygenase n=1 Tax=Streptosporangium becharense TaxID=1816182 RepID=A0A7W9IBE1_9ACTN|nr:hypothetical protein [Streptosporangium becharense]MBB2910610.1 isopenicillin N synthase-like dioxygenase [Streptosporangium becharense]MBB5817306.1 isopenicillin N synthase-like dioxygenase [Streptosporangium becharense]
MTRTSPAGEILRRGHATIPLTAAEAGVLATLRAEAARFFTLDEAVKRRHGSDDFNFGFRPFGRQYSVSPDRPDMNESFTYWADAPGTVPNGEDIAPFLTALGAYWAVAARAADDILTGLAAHYGHPEPALDFRDSSYLEVNWYLRDDERDLLQDRHEDGHLLTLANSDGPGLETESAGRMRPVAVPDGHLLAMPGSLLTSMTDGQVRPLYHQVRNHRLRRRVTVLFLVNPRFDRPVRPYVTGRSGEVDIAAMARTGGSMFGLPPAPILKASPRR